MTSAVADAGPLMHLHEIDRFSLLQLFAPLHIPDAVWQETVDQGRLTQDDVLPLVNVQRSSLFPSEIDRFIQDNHLENLQAGECQCLKSLTKNLYFSSDSISNNLKAMSPSSQRAPRQR